MPHCKHEQRAYHYAFRLTASGEASDVVADAFVRIFNALKNFKGTVLSQLGCIGS